MPTKLTPEQTEQRKRAIVAAKRAHEPFDAIAATHGISISRAHQIYWAALKEIPAGEVAQHRQEQQELSDRAINRLLAIAESDDADVSWRTRVEAWSSIRGWAEHKAKLLATYAPQRKEVTVLTEDTVDAALREVAEQHAARARELEELDRRATAALAELGADV